MNRRLKNCFFLPICVIFFLSGFVYSEEDKTAVKCVNHNKAQIEKNLMNLSGILFPWENEEYFMEILKPNPFIDSEIVKNTYDLNTDYELTIINPDTKKELTGKAPCSVLPHNKFQLHRTDKKYSMNIIRPNPDIDPEIVKNTYDQNIDYKLRVINPYTGKEITGTKGPCPVSPQNKFLPEGKR